LANQLEKKTAFEKERLDQEKNFVHGIAVEEITEKRNADKQKAMEKALAEIKELRGVC
jgi:hypothetical protein